MWLLAIGTAASACDRAVPPAAGLAAAADAVVIGHGDRDRLVVDLVLRGEVGADALEVRVEKLCGRVDALDTAPFAYHLRRDPDAWVVLADGRAPAGLKVPTEIVAAVARAGNTAWSPVSDGWSTMIVEELARAGEPPGTSLTAVIRNHSPASRTLQWRDWPREQASHVTLAVAGPAGSVAAVPTQITPDAVQAYFEPNGRAFEIALEPGEFWLFPLATIDAAPEGWGYKEALNFSYYPLVAPGKYEIVARFRNLADPAPPPTAALIVSR